MSALASSVAAMSQRHEDLLKLMQVQGGVGGGWRAGGGGGPGGGEAVGETEHFTSVRTGAFPSGATPRIQAPGPGQEEVVQTIWARRHSRRPGGVGVTAVAAVAGRPVGFAVEGATAASASPSGAAAPVKSARAAAFERARRRHNGQADDTAGFREEEGEGGRSGKDDWVAGERDDGALVGGKAAGNRSTGVHRNRGSIFTHQAPPLLTVHLHLMLRLIYDCGEREKRFLLC